MTDLDPITEVADAWINGQSSPDRRGDNYGSTDKVILSGGTVTKRGLLKPELPSVAGRTVLGFTATGVAAEALAAQTITVTPITQRWSEGRVTWTNPSTGGPTVNSAAAVTVSVPATPKGGIVTLTGLGPMLQSVADGDDWFGVRLSTNATTEQKFVAGKWTFYPVVSEEQDGPTGLKPDGGLAVESPTPILSWDPVDDQAQTWVQVDTPASGAEPDAVSPDYSSGWQSNGDSQWSLVGRRTLVGAGPHYFRVAVPDDLGNPLWSDWAEFTVTAMPSLVVDSPTGPFGDPSPVVSAHLSSGTVKQWDVMVTGSSRAEVRFDSELQTSGTVSLTVPEFVNGKRVIREDDPGWIRLRVWPTGNWATAVGQLPYRLIWIPIEFDDDLAQARVTNLSVTQLAAGDPRLIWSFQDTEDADAYLLMVGDVTVRRVTPAEMTVSAGSYSFTDGGEVPSYRTHDLSVRRLEGDQRSQPRTVSRSHDVHGVWLFPEDPDIEPMVFDEGAIGDWTVEDAVASYRTIDGGQVDIIYGTPGRSNVFEGQVHNNQDVWAVKDRLERLRKSKNRRARLVWPGDSIKVEVRSPNATAANEFRANNGLHNVRFGFRDVGDS